MMTSVHVTCIIRCPHLYQKQQNPQAPSRRPYAVAMPHRSPYGPYSHTVSLTRRSPRPARVLAGLQSIHGGSSTPADLIPAKTSADGPLKYASNQLTQIPCASEGGMGTASLRDATTTGALRFKPARRPALRPRAWIPEESGQIELDKSPQMRRQGNRIRRTDDGSRRPPARPGVTLAPGFAVSTSLLYHVFLEVSR